MRKKSNESFSMGCLTSIVVLAAGAIIFALIHAISGIVIFIALTLFLLSFIIDESGLLNWFNKDT